MTTDDRVQRPAITTADVLHADELERAAYLRSLSRA
jgi:hypothetical protein